MVSYREKFAWKMRFMKRNMDHGSVLFTKTRVGLFTKTRDQGLASPFSAKTSERKPLEVCLSFFYYGLVCLPDLLKYCIANVLMLMMVLMVVSGYDGVDGGVWVSR